MSDERFARQYRFGLPSGFPLTSSCTSIVHHLSGPSIYALARLFTKDQVQPDLQLPLRPLELEDLFLDGQLQRLLQARQGGRRLATTDMRDLLWHGVSEHAHGTWVCGGVEASRQQGRAWVRVRRIRQVCTWRRAGAGCTGLDEPSASWWAWGRTGRTGGAGRHMQ